MLARFLSPAGWLSRALGLGRQPALWLWSPLVLVAAVLVLALPVTCLPRVAEMSPSDVSSWLSSLSLSQYAQLFTSRAIDGSSLTQLSADDLQQLGIAALGHRKKILKAIADLKQTPQSPPPAASRGVSEPAAPPASASSVACTLGVYGDARCEGKVWLGVRSESEDVSSESWLEEAWPHPFDTARCTIDRLPMDAMTPALFRSSYYLQKPFILTPTAASAAATLRARAAWSRQRTLAELGSIPVNLGTPHSLTAFGDGVVSSTLGAYILDLRNASVDRISGDHYLFDRKGFFKHAASLLQSYAPHRLFHWDTAHGQYGLSDSMTYALGPTGSGINFHYHKDGWNEVLFGRKRWFLYPPSVGCPPGGYNQFEAALRWYADTYASLPAEQLPVECMQYPGEVFYVPEDWYHATINVGETVAVVGQASQPAQGTMMYHVYAGLEFGDRGDRQQSLAHFSEALRLAPNHPQIFNYFGNHYKQHNELQTAVSFYRQAVASNPKYAMAWLSLGQTLSTLQLADEAYDALLRSFQLNPRYHETLLELGNAAYFLGRLQQSAAWLEQAVTVGKEDKRSNAYINLCSIYIALERPLDCQKLAEQRLVSFPREWYLWTVYAQALGAAGRRGEAKGILRDVMRRNAGDFPPAQQVWARIEEQEEEELRRRGIEGGKGEGDSEREVGMDEMLKQLKEGKSGSAAAEQQQTARRGEKRAAEVKVSVSSSASPISSPAPPRALQPPRYLDNSGISTAGIPRELKLVSSFSLAALFPSSVRRVPLQPSLITVPPLLSDPHPPLFVGGTASSRKKREDECAQYMKTRVVSSAFAVEVWNNWMQATGGRLFGDLVLHAITPQQRREGEGEAAAAADGGSEEDVVFAAWDGMVFSPSHFFSYERWCVAGHHCILEEMQSLQLLDLRPSSSSGRTTLRLPSLAVFTGAVFHLQARRVANPRDFGLGIKVDHVAKNSAAFQRRMAEKPTVREGAVIYPLQLGSALQLQQMRGELEAGCSSARLERHHYPAIVVLEQFMSGVNYAHFLTEILPKLALLQLQRAAASASSPLRDAYLLLQPQPFVPELLQLLNVSASSVLFSHPCVLHSADVVYQFTPLPLDLPTAESVAVVRRSLSLPAVRGQRRHRADGSREEQRKAGEGRAAEEKRALLAGDGPLLLSLFRPFPQSRSVSNSEAVHAALAAAFPSLPLVAFDPANFTVNEAVTLFSRAAVVVGVIGAGFANLAFAPLQPPPLVLQLLPTVTHRRIPCGLTPWWQYADVLGLPTRSLTLEGLGFDEGGWELPINELQRFVDKWKILATSSND